MILQDLQDYKTAIIERLGVLFSRFKILLILSNPVNPVKICRPAPLKNHKLPGRQTQSLSC